MVTFNAKQNIGDLKANINQT